jgi:hypothetical protein
VDTATGTTSSPQSASSQRIGRVKASCGSFHRMFFADRRAATTLPSTSASTSGAARPVSCFCT